MLKQLNIDYKSFFHGIGNSYSQIFFSNNKIFAIILVAVTFFDLYSGISGLLAVVSTNVLASIMGFRLENIKSGLYGFNSLLVGLALGVFYQPGFEYFLVLIFASAFTLFITIALEGVIGKYGLPYLSIPFLLVVWIIILASRTFETFEISERGVFALNEMYAIGGPNMVKIYEWFSDLDLPKALNIYFRSLGAIFFQYHLFTGIIIAIGLLIYSRISFVLSLIGFFSAYYFYQLVGADISELNYSYIGFNFILTAIAIGGFFIVPSWNSYLWVILLTPLISFTISSTNALFSIFQLSIYSLPFNLIVLLFLYILKFRERKYKSPELVLVQQFSPERNVYNRMNLRERFDDNAWVPVSLPFWGEWTVTQGYDGQHTHKEDWKHALDFEIKDEDGILYKGAGKELSDYYCFNKPILAPADGWIETIQDGIDDNKIGEVNLKQNWGNTIIIKHAEKLYSKISHLKKDVFKVSKGDFVRKGDILGYCGNSGRSPIPHIHFQMQNDPFIGSKTIEYPLAYYLSSAKNTINLKSYSIPDEGDLISNVSSIPLLSKALKFVPGQKLKFEVEDKDSGAREIVKWEVKADLYKNTFIESINTGAKAYFKVDEGILYFINFKGNRKSLLFNLYLGLYKSVFGFYQGLEINDNLPVNTFKAGFLSLIQDFVSPFTKIMSVNFKLSYSNYVEDFSNSRIKLNAKITTSFGNKIHPGKDIEFLFEKEKIHTISIKSETQNIEARWVR